jgi:hypothetical protein
MSFVRKHFMRMRGWRFLDFSYRSDPGMAAKGQKPTLKREPAASAPQRWLI